MSNPSNFEDNLFFVSARLRHLQDGLQLELDPDLFLHRYVEDILFVHDMLTRINLQLIKNTFFINRLPCLRILLLTKKDFIGFLDSVELHDEGFALHLNPFQNQLSQCRSSHQSDISLIHDILDQQLDIKQEEQDIISKDEYNFLFKQDNE